MEFRTFRSGAARFWSSLVFRIGMTISAAGLAWGVCAAGALTNAPVILYSTHFESAEGFSVDKPLAGQNDWVQEGTGGNGLATGFFEGFGQQAFIGFSPPVQSNEFLNVWRPVQAAPINPAQPLVTFSVLMQIFPSTNGHSDDFRWSLYNTNADRLFSIDFDTSTSQVNYALDDNQFVSTGRYFDDGLYQLVVYMNFARNHWTATLNGAVLASGLPMTTVKHALNFGDMDAVWAIRRPGSAGDNFMVFDDYEIRLELETSIPAVLEPVGVDKGEFNFRLYGEPGSYYAVDVSSDFKTWFELGKYLAPANGVFLFNDNTAVNFSRGIYRARSL